MGKKSRRKKKKNGSITSTQNGAGSAELRDEIVSYATESSFANPFENEPTPKYGWAQELRKAESELRHNSHSTVVVIRAAKAARVMRQFDRLGHIIDEAESAGVTFDGADNQALIREWKDTCSSRNALRTRVNEPQMQSLFRAAIKKDTSLDSTGVDHPSYSNFNVLDHAAFQGDVQLLERLVGLGAALDYTYEPHVTARRNDSVKTKKSPGSTALLLAVIGAMCCRINLALEGDGEDYREMYEGGIECAIALVMMGANVDVRLQQPTGRDANLETYVMMRCMKWVGKTVRELAPETGSELLVQTIELFNSAEEKIKRANCRCGSRLPWKKCHSGTIGSGCHYKSRSGLENESGKILWRYSPCAPCPCKNSKKIHFKCCWGESFRDYFQDDETAKLCVSTTTAINEHNREFVTQMYEARSYMGAINPDDILKMKCDAIRKGGPSMLEEVSRSIHPKSKIGTWDPNVYAGVMEQLGNDDFFQWNDVHWNIPKPELLKRVNEWNDALEQYCDSEGIAGSERGEVIKLHTASPLAPYVLT
mmetsp:Transcript_21673/g.47111  ORF Transcript_21673/g.47111 Transcript_21673/m.47111 type:complete len:537 (-) Transcript_21673:174-1784(-)